jgi:serine/threonine-protein kinase
MSLQPGDTLLNGQYRIVRLLGRGGFGFVYLAQDTLLREEVAIKELIPALVGDEAMLKRFLAEAKATMRLTHERIVRTHAVFSERGNYYIVMEYLAGGSLETALQERGALTVDEAVHIAADVAEGLSYAHERGVVHCDLKPANVLFTSDPLTGTGGHAKIADFGIAHVPREMFSRSWATASGFVAGTLPYMSPEQADGVRDDPRADLYALGAVLYRTLTGRTYLEFDPRDTPARRRRTYCASAARRPSRRAFTTAACPRGWMRSCSRRWRSGPQTGTRTPGSCARRCCGEEPPSRRRPLRIPPSRFPWTGCRRDL